MNGAYTCASLTRGSCGFSKTSVIYDILCYHCCSWWLCVPTACRSLTTSFSIVVDGSTTFLMIILAQRVWFSPFLNTHTNSCHLLTKFLPFSLVQICTLVPDIFWECFGHDDGGGRNWFFGQVLHKTSWHQLSICAWLVLTDSFLFPRSHNQSYQITAAPWAWFILLTGSFASPLLSKCLLKGSHLIVGFLCALLKFIVKITKIMI